MEAELSTDWNSLKEFTIENIDKALEEFKPTESNTETTES